MQLPQKTLLLLSITASLGLGVACGSQEKSTGPSLSELKRQNSELFYEEPIQPQDILDDVVRIERENHLGYKLFMRLYDDAGDVVGTVRAPYFTWRRTIQIFDASGELLYEARKDLLSWGSRVQIFGPDKKTVHFVIKENVFQSLLKVVTQFEVKNQDLETIGKSKKVSVFTTEVEIEDPNDPGTVYFGFKKNPFGGLAEFFSYDKWSLNTYDYGDIGKVVPITIASMQTLSDIEKMIAASSGASSSTSSRSSSRR